MRCELFRWSLLLSRADAEQLVLAVKYPQLRQLSTSFRFPTTLPSSPSCRPSSRPSVRPLPRRPDCALLPFPLPLPLRPSYRPPLPRTSMHESSATPRAPRPATRFRSLRAASARTLPRHLLARSRARPSRACRRTLLAHQFRGPLHRAEHRRAKGAPCRAPCGATENVRRATGRPSQAQARATGRVSILAVRGRFFTPSWLCD